MDVIFGLIFFLSPILLIVGLVKPNLFNKIPIKNLNRKKLSGIFISLFLASVVGIGLTVDPPPESDYEEPQTLGEETQVSSSELDTSHVIVSRVIDGDTIELKGGSKVRYIGIDTPEFNPTQCYAEQAKAKNRELVEGKEVRLEKDVSETDRYDRLLRYVWTGDTMLNELLVREGYAQSSTYPPDVKYQERLREAERLAREGKKGLWGDICLEPTNTPVPTTKPTVAPAVYIAPTVTPTVYVAPTSAPYVYPTSPPPPTNPPSGGESSGSWTCNCSKTCPNMSSCEEAYFQLNNCGCSVRDGDNDGVPCEIICPGG
jgi:micrococcal nuclease